MIKKKIQRFLKLRTDVDLSYYLTSFFFKHILFHHRQLPWHIHHTSTVYSPQKIVRGKGVYPGDSPGNYIEASNGIFIGDYTNLGPNVGLISANHDLIDNTKHIKANPIKIGSFCWLGMNSVILPEVELGDFTIVGAGAVVTKSFSEGYCVIGGNPARIIKHLDKNACEQYREKKGG
jgi:acetyltransferase-like isoleucine patch superfamily enzyme